MVRAAVACRLKDAATAKATDVGWVRGDTRMDAECDASESEMPKDIER